MSPVKMRSSMMSPLNAPAIAAFPTPIPASRVYDIIFASRPANSIGALAQAERLDRPREPTKWDLPHPKRDLVPPQGVGEERKNSEKAQEPSELRDRVLLALPDLIRKPDEEPRAEVERREQDRQVHHVVDVERLVNQAFERDVDAKRRPAQLFPGPGRCVKRHPERFAENEEAEGERPQAADAGHQEQAAGHGS